VRVVTETLDEQGNVTATSTTDRRTVLRATGATYAELGVRVTVEVAGKRFDAEPRNVVEGYCGQDPDEQADIGAPKAAKVTIEKRTVPCQVQQIEVRGAGTKQVTNIYFSDELQPSVLKRESVTTSTESGEKLSESVTEVLALAMPFRVLTELQQTAQLRTVHEHANGKVVKLWVTSPDVPGGEVAAWTKELDAEGNVVSRSTLELLDYGLKSRELRTGLFGRRRGGRVYESAQ